MAHQINNPFEEIVTRLESIEGLLHNLTNQPGPVEEVKPIDKLLSTQETAVFLGLSKPTIYSKVSRGELPVMKQGNRLYFSESELRDYLKVGKRKSNAEIQAEAESYLSGRKEASHGRR